MPKFIAVHTLPPNAISREQVDRLAQAAQEDPKVHGYRSFLSLSEGKAVCILEAPEKRDVTDWCRKMGLPVDSVTRLELEGDHGHMMDVSPDYISSGASW